MHLKKSSAGSITITDIICAVLLLLFVYTAINKLEDLQLFTVTLSVAPLIGPYATMLAILIPVVELVISLLLFISSTKHLGLYLATALLTVFTAYLLWMVIYAPQLPCSCGGVIRYLTWSQHVAFNMFFILLSLIGILQEKGRKRIFAGYC